MARLMLDRVGSRSSHGLVRVPILGDTGHFGAITDRRGMASALAPYYQAVPRTVGDGGDFQGTKPQQLNGPAETCKQWVLGGRY